MHAASLHRPSLSASPGIPKLSRERAPEIRRGAAQQLSHQCQGMPVSQLPSLMGGTPYRGRLQTPSNLLVRDSARHFFRVGLNRNSLCGLRAIGRVTRNFIDHGTGLPIDRNCRIRHTNHRASHQQNSHTHLTQSSPRFSFATQIEQQIVSIMAKLRDPKVNP